MITTLPARTGTPPTAPRRHGITIGGIGLLVRRRGIVALLGCLLVLTALTVVALTTGALDLPLERVLAALRGQGTRIENLVVIDHRLVRMLLGALVGFALGCAGALTQTITRNPIATPDILGVTAGAGAAAVLLLTNAAWAQSAFGIDARALLGPASIVGGLLATAVILTTAWRGGFDGYRPILVGLGFNALLIAATSWMLTRASIEEASIATRWLIGSLEGSEASDLLVLGPLLVVASLACVVLAPMLGTLRLGRDVATALGTRTAAVETSALVIAVLIVSAATATAGPIGFVAFVAPQAALRLFGTAGPPPLAAGLVGAVLLLGSDLVAERLPVSLPVGIVTTIVGAPALLWFMAGRLRRSSV
ncbi:MAG: iron chelate uptake ABC transporter family permease subunit [Micropruina sp.]|uniref:FecCD family ABC transporter permease n=1 Tax=Micropruina sp. TaxID=2737536 RepID=UPI0039E46C22